MPEFLPLIKETKNKLLHVDEKEDDTDNESDDDFFDEEVFLILFLSCMKLRYEDEKNLKLPAVMI